MRKWPFRIPADIVHVVRVQARPPAASFGFLASALLVALASYPITAARAQTPPKDTTSVSDTRLADNPLLAELRRVRPQQLPLVLTKLESLATPMGGSRGPMGVSRGDTKPTAAEARQLSRNPNFDAAFASNPAETLRLLRWINRQLASPP